MLDEISFDFWPFSFEWRKIAEISSQENVLFKYQMPNQIKVKEQTQSILDTKAGNLQKPLKQIKNCDQGKKKVKWTISQKDEFIKSCHRYLIQYPSANISWKVKKPLNFFTYISSTLNTRNRENIKSHHQNIKKKNQQKYALLKQDFKDYINERFAQIQERQMEMDMHNDEIETDTINSKNQVSEI